MKFTKYFFDPLESEEPGLLMSLSKGGTLQGNTTALIDERIKNVLDNYFDKFAPPNIRTKTDLAVTKHKQRPLPYCSEQLILW